MAKVSSRRKAREFALEVLYMFETQGGPDYEALERFWSDKRTGGKIRERAEALIKGVLDNRDRIDRNIEEASENWRLNRMSRVDRSVLRLGVFEMLVEAETPPQVCINEAVDIARKYGDTGSPSFVNGVLDRILKEGIADAS